LRIPPEKGGGVENAILLWSRYFAEFGHNIVILDRRYDDSRTNGYVDGVRIIRLPAKTLQLSSFLRFSRLRPAVARIKDYSNEAIFALQVWRFLRRNDVEVVHIHTMISGLLLINLARNLRNSMFYTSHQPVYSETRIKVRRKIVFGLEVHIMKRVRKAIVLNDSQRLFLIRAGKIRPGNVATARVSVDSSATCTSVNTYEARSMFSLEGKNIVLSVARLSPEKGTEFLIRAADRIVNQQRRKNVVFVFVGPGTGFGAFEQSESNYISKIRALVSQFQLSENVRFTGAVSSGMLNNLFAISDLLVLPSLNEGEPGVVVQAMAWGKPVVASRVGGIPLQVIDGWNGILVQPGDYRMLAEKITYLLDNISERVRMGENAKSRVDEEFDYKVVGKKLLEAYKRQLND
jgi:glycosyltransferase involved in cell wall biosynthesis